MEDNFVQFEEYLKSRGFEYIGCGSFRRGFRRNKIIIKVPRNDDGLYDNRVEAAAWHKYKNQPSSQGIILAPCRLLSNGCLMMVRVERKYFTEEAAPSWAKAVEGWQVGTYRGRLVAFDFALDITEREEWELQWGVRSEFYYGHR